MRPISSVRHWGCPINLPLRFGKELPEREVAIVDNFERRRATEPSHAELVCNALTTASNDQLNITIREYRLKIAPDGHLMIGPKLADLQQDVAAGKIKPAAVNASVYDNISPQRLSDLTGVPIQDLPQQRKKVFQNLLERGQELVRANPNQPLSDLETASASEIVAGLEAIDYLENHNVDVFVASGTDPNQINLYGLHPNVNVVSLPEAHNNPFVTERLPGSAPSFVTPVALVNHLAAAA